MTVGVTGPGPAVTEHELERTRREDDEYRSRLELDRTKNDLRNDMENIESIYELRRQLMEEKTNEAKERRFMSIEEICCTVPPLTQPKPVELTMANENTLWIAWDRVKLNADNRPVNPEDIKYLYGLHEKWVPQTVCRGSGIGPFSTT